MELRDRLKAMGVRPRVPGSGAPTPPGSSAAPPETSLPVLREAADAAISGLSAPVVRGSRKKLTLDQALPGAWHETSEGRCYYAERRYSLDHARGPVSLGSLLHARPSVLWDAGRASSMRDLDARRLLFLDTETTGLSGGAGVYIFLVGVAFFSGSSNEVVVRQYFLSDVSEEKALLHALNDLFREFEAVVSFNGKSFDWPLLVTRYTSKRMSCLLEDPPHLDMLGPSRRLWKDRLPSCSLETLERMVLGVTRDFDVPGWRIPSMYIEYLHAKHVGRILPVFDHNEHDLLTLVALTGHVGRILDAPDEIDLQAAEVLGLAKLYEDLGRYEESLKAYERGIALDPSPELRSTGLRRLSLLYKHLQQRDEAVAIWARLAAEGTELMFPYLELAKHFEHRLRDYAAAEEYTLLALSRTSSAVERAELGHRLARIRAKASRAACRDASENREQAGA